MITTDYYTEGPVIDKSGNIYVTNLQGGQILKVEEDETLVEWAHCTSPNGQFIAPNGDHYVCNSVKGSIERFDAGGTHIKTMIPGRIQGYRVQCPNDLWVEKQGLFFTDSRRHKGAVLFIDNSGTGYMIAKNLDYPNGIVYNQRLNFLYVAESFKNRILKIDLNQKGYPIETLINLPNHPSLDESRNLPDGLFLERDQNLWVAHHGMGMIHRYCLANKKLMSYQSKITLTSNIYVNNATIVITGGEAEPGPGLIRIIKREGNEFAH